MRRVISTAAMRESDEYTIKHITSGRELMFRAGKAVFDAADWRGRTAIVCGSGNNAGDGYVLALLLKEQNIPCDIYLTSEKFSTDGRYYFDRCVEKGIPVIACSSDEDFAGYEYIVDCIFGTGFKGSPSDAVSRIIDRINAAPAKRICVDINSGLDGDSGMAEKCVLSDLTVSIGCYKSGHFLNMAKDCIGALINADIGIRLPEDGFFLLENADISPLLPPRKNFCHKGSYGSTALIGASARYPGAIKLAGLSAAALRAGCGTSRIIAPRSLCPALSAAVLESTLYAVSEKDGSMMFVKEEFDAALKNVTAAAAGMGWGNADKEILRYLLTEFVGTLVIDADGLNILAKEAAELLPRAKPRVILTPHIKEFSRLSGKDTCELMRNPIAAAKAYAKDNNVVLLLKGTATIITDGDSVYLCAEGVPGMATAGSGDVLSGIILGLAGWNADCLAAAAAGTFIAGVAGRIAQEKMTDIAMLSGDTVLAIPDAIKLIRGCSDT